MTKRERIIIGIILAAGLLFRLFLLKWRWAVAFDEGHYLNLAATMLKDWKAGLHPYWSPGFPMLIATAGRIVTDLELAARLVNILLGVFTIIPVFYFTRRIAGEDASVASGWLAALYPPLVFLQTSVLAEPAMIAFGFWGVWLLFRAIENRTLIYGLIAGLSFGFAYLCKPEGFGFLLVGLGMAAGFVGYRLITRLRPLPWQVLPVCLAGFLMLGSIYLVYLRSEAGYWTLSAKGAANQQFHKTFFTPEDDDIFRDLNPENTSLPMDVIFHEGSFLKNKEAAPFKLPLSYLIKKYATNLFRIMKYGLPSFLTFWGLILITIGLFGAPWPREKLWPVVYLLAFPTFYWFVLIPSFTLLERYMQTMLPAALVWMGTGLIAFKDWSAMVIRETRLKRHSEMSGAVMTFLLAGLLVIPEMGKIAGNGPAESGAPIESREAGLWIHRYGGVETPVIMSYNKGIDYYAGGYDIRKAVSFPQDSTSRLLAYADHKGVDFFVVEERFLDIFPNLRDWVDGSVPESLELVHESTGPAGLRAWVFIYKDTESAEPR
jgi:4-amino-4-deoxy-L-arabinose transferase-like glycosyltransferase